MKYKEWYHLGEIRFSRNQMWFLIFNLNDLSKGHWPERPAHITGYTDIDPARKVRRYREPSINRVLEIAAEVEVRLQMVIPCISGKWRPQGVFKKREY